MPADGNPIARRRRVVDISAAIFIIASSSYFSMILGVVRSLWVMRLIGPAAQGVRRTVDIINKYLFNAHLGILHGVSKQISVQMGQNRLDEVKKTQDVGVTWIITLTAVAAIGMVIWGLSNPTGERTTQIAIIIGGGWLLTQQMYVTYRCVMRAWGEFTMLGMVAAIDTIATFGLTILGAIHFGVLGAMAGTLAGWCLALLSFHFYSRLRIKPDFDFQEAYRLIKAGIPIAAIIFADVLLKTIDGAIIVRFYDAHRFGLYSVAMQLSAYLFAIPESAGFVIWPKILEAFGAARGNGLALRREILLPTLTAGIFMPLLAGLAYILVPPIIMLVIPSFASSIPAVQVLSMATVFLAIPLATNSLLIALDREFAVVFTKIVGAAISAGGCLWLVFNNGSLEQMAAFAGSGYAVAAIISAAMVIPMFESGFTRIFKLVIFIFLPFLWSCAALFISYHAAAVFVEPSPISWEWAVVRTVVFVLLMLPVAVYGDRQTGLAERIKAALNRRKQRKLAKKSNNQNHHIEDE